ncbi:VOC family protein [Desulfonatronovibrio hydrogenovorans]|uniref:VOC family protein n=1 Tax=Desulfonatronovibrio hydrogenovorans TaxID=53245 RepID=UPI00048BD708|nr:VOC family protein [Desulfonatronovibrio hydrogenovorans]
MQLKGINHLALATGNMDGTIVFWRDLVGLRLIAGLGKPGYRQYFFELGPMNMLLFFEWEGVEPLPEKDHGVPVHGPFAFDHLALEVESKDDLWTMYDRLCASDFWVSEVLDHGFILSIYSFDPNNIPIEFSWSNPEVDLRNNPRMLDQNPCAQALLGPDPVKEQLTPVTRPTPDKEKIVYPGEGSQFINKKNKW